MATKAYKHKEYKEYSTKGSVPYSDEQFDMIKDDLLPKSKFGSMSRNGAGADADAEYHYEYHEERHPSGKYDRKDLHTVQQYTSSPKPLGPGNASYHYKEEGSFPSINTSSSSYQEHSSSTPGYSKIKSTSNKKEMHQNIEELDSLLDDLQRDQERQLYKGGYTSDTVDTSSFDYRKTTPVKSPALPVSPPSSGYSSIKKAEHQRQETRQWLAPAGPAPVDYVSRSPSPAVREKEIRMEHFKEEKTESRIVPSQISPAIPHQVPAVVCHQCHNPTGTLSGTPMNKVTTTVKTYTYEIPADQDPTKLPIPGATSSPHVTSEKHHEEHKSYITKTSTGSVPIPPSPSLGCQYCSHCNSRITTRDFTVVDGPNRTPLAPLHSHAPAPLTGKETHMVRSAHYESSTNHTGGYPPVQPEPLPPITGKETHVTRTAHYESSNSGPGGYPTTDRSAYPPARDTRSPPASDYPPNNGQGPYGPTTYKWSETNYSSYNTNTSNGGPAGAPPATLERHLPLASPGPFPRPHTPSPSGEPPKRIDDLMAEFPHTENLSPSQTDGAYRRKNAELSARKDEQQAARPAPTPVTNSKNVAGPAVYYPPGSESFTKKEEGSYQAGGGESKAKGKYMYEASGKSKSKHSESKTTVPVCLPLCCAMPCSIM